MDTPSFINLALALLAATNHFYLGVIGVATSRASPVLNRLFSAIAFVGAWWTLWVALIFQGLGERHPHVIGMAMLFSGFLGPLLFLFTVALTTPLQSVPRKLYASLLFGLFGSGACLYILFSPSEATGAIRDCALANPLRCAQLFPFGFALYAANVLELAAFVMLGLAVAVRTIVRRPDPQTRRFAWMILLTLTIGGAVIFVTDILAATVPALRSIRLAPILTVPFAFLLYFAVISSRRVIRKMQEQQHYMGRYLPRELVLKIFSGEQSYQLGGEETEATILFSDIRGFTTLSQQLSPGETVDFLNAYLKVMTEVVFQHGGMINKFIGDAVLAVFGLPRAGDRDADAAVACARDMLKRLSSFNHWWTGRGHEPIRIGIGLHRGRVVHGNVGSESRMEYTVIGDVVNTASRLESLTKEKKVEVILSAAVWEALGQRPPDIRPLGSTPIRGRRGRLKIYALRPVDSGNG